jgi:phospholipid N-methyltransferase
MHIWDEFGAFFREFQRTFYTTGAILPSSRFLAWALTKHLAQPRQACRLLEVGPGTGAVTRAIARNMGLDDFLDAVEVNARFVQVLEGRIERERVFAPFQDQIHVIHAALEDLIGEGVYDYIVSGLPLNNFSSAQVREIFAAYERLLKPGGTLTYYEYAWVRQLQSPFVSKRERRRLFRVGRLMRGYIRDYQVRREQILINVPPATVRHLCFKPAPSEVLTSKGKRL